MPKEYANQAKSYSQRVGRLLWSYNRLHGQLCVAFTLLVNSDRRSLGASVWHALKADTAQRDALRAALNDRGEIPIRLIEALEWLLDVIGKLSQYRNDSAHVPMVIGVDLEAKEAVILPDLFAADPKRATRLSRKDLKAFQVRLEGDLIALSEYAKYVNLWLAMWLRERKAKQPPLPYRPRIQALQPSEIPLTRSQKDRLQKRKERERQRRSSHRK